MNDWRPFRYRAIAVIDSLAAGGCDSFEARWAIEVRLHAPMALSVQVIWLTPSSAAAAPRCHTVAVIAEQLDGLRLMHERVSAFHLLEFIR